MKIYKIRDIVVYHKNILRVEQIDNNYYYFTIIKNVHIKWYSNADGLYPYPKSLFFNFPLIQDLTNEEKLELL